LIGGTLACPHGAAAQLAAVAHADVPGLGPHVAVLPLAGAAASADALEGPPLRVDGRYVVIRLAENRLDVMEDGRVLWQAPVATGTGFRLAGAGQTWRFSTPRGVFRVQRREKDPVWIMPDWAFIEAGQRVPPADSPRRRRPGALGTTALYIDHDLAIHGTERPELVLRDDPDARRVSHGCIRMTNEDARMLYYLVDVGTPVLIY
jgi:lipoprotein-anchoring transpeptidase ErfK/SrfK